MRFFDLHCDTLYKATTQNSDFNNDTYHITLNKASNIENYKQIFAIWIPDEIKGEYATALFNNAVKKFHEIKVNNGNIQMMFAVENASMLNGDFNNIKLLVDNCAKYVTLTWNDDNELGSGVYSIDDFGLTTFGKEVVKELENNNIVVDVSHASDKLFYDIIKVSSKPFIASHSNSRKVTNVKRNLTDDQFKIIRDNGGIVGLNFYKGFLNDNENMACVDDIIRHAEHFLNLNGENVVSIGADFDGADMPSDINGIESLQVIYNRFVEEFGLKITEKIFFKNADNFFTNFDKIKKM